MAPNAVLPLVEEVGAARAAYIEKVNQLTRMQACWKPDPGRWNILEITEHLFWAEQGAINGMWKTLHAIRAGTMEGSYESEHKGLPIEKIIEKTWRVKENVPASAAPRMGGTLIFWILSLRGLQDILFEFGSDLKDDELRLQAHPHPISGPLDFQQRIEFLRFHINRHADQVSALIKEMPL